MERLLHKGHVDRCNLQSDGAGDRNQQPGVREEPDLGERCSQRTEIQEDIRKTHGIVIDGLGEVQIMVSDEHAAEARELLAAVERGELFLEDDEGADD